MNHYYQEGLLIYILDVSVFLYILAEQEWPSHMLTCISGVSCDGCMAPNFAGDRYKCLRCYDFDLCSRCYMEERATEASSENRSFRETNEEHSPSHPMQCIMTQQDFGIFM